MSTKYISFCGTFMVPDNIDQLNIQYPRHVYLDEEGYVEVDNHIIEYAKYELIDSEDSLNVYLAILEDKIVGHLVADCQQAGWTESTFVKLDEDNNPLRPKENTNPNPIRQLVNGKD